MNWILLIDGPALYEAVVAFEAGSFQFRKFVELIAAKFRLQPRPAIALYFSQSVRTFFPRKLMENQLKHLSAANRAGITVSQQVEYDCDVESAWVKAEKNRLRYSSKIAYMLGALANTQSNVKVFVVSDAAELINPILDSREAGLDVIPTFFRERLSSAWRRRGILDIGGGRINKLFAEETEDLGSLMLQQSDTKGIVSPALSWGISLDPVDRQARKELAK